MGKKVIFLGIIVIILLISIIIIIEVFVPRWPKYPYFLKSSKRVSGLNWPLGEVQPVYLWSFVNNKALYFKTTYRDKVGWPRLLNVFVGGVKNGKDYTLAPFIKNDLEIVNNKKLGEYAFPFKFGQQLRVEYFIEVDDSESQIRTEICNISQRFCDLTSEVAKTNKDVYTSFSQGFTLPHNQSLPAYEIFFNLKQ